MFKKLHSSRLTTLVIVIGIIMSSCGSSKKLPKAENPSGETHLKVYCSGPEFRSDDKYFRSNSEGESLDAVTSKKKALINARAEMAAQIKAVITGMEDNYKNSMELNNVENIEEKFQSFTRQMLDQELAGTRTICEERTKTSEGKYKTYIALELAGDEIFNAMNQRLSKDAKTKIDYDYEKFRGAYEKALQDYREKNQ